MMMWYDIDKQIEALRKSVVNNAVKLRNQVRQGFFKFKPFSLKQKKVLTWWCPDSPVKDYEGIIADGSIRSGKTLCMSLSFVIWAMTVFDGQNFAICGKTIGSLRRNVIFWLKLMLRSRGYVVQDRRAENLLIIRKGNRLNYFYEFGGKDERSQDLIQGITLAGLLCDEVALMPESFVNQATARCSVAGSKFWFNCNPEGPQHWFYVNWIRKCRKKRLLYLHFTMDDNLSLDGNIKARYRSQYIGVFFDRYILGLWVAAEGLIYSMFSEKEHVVPVIPADKAGKLVPRKYTEFMLSCDYGTQNATVFLLWGFYSGAWYIIREYYHSGRDTKRQKTDEEYYQDLVVFVADTLVRGIIVDPSAASFIACIRRHGRFVVYPANNSVVDGIRLTGSLMTAGKLFICEGCNSTIGEIRSYCWDDKPGEDAPIKENDHAMDAMRYMVYTHIRRNAYRYGLHMLEVKEE